MKYIKTLLNIFSILFITVQLSAQNKNDIEIFENLFEPTPHVHEYRQYIENNNNEFHWLASGLFVFYKSFFSSQDGNHCVFHPSCSVYAIQSIKKKGLIIGFADAIDRLSRCNRLSPEKYSKFENTDLLFDPLW